MVTLVLESCLSGAQAGFFDAQGHALAQGRHEGRGVADALLPLIDEQRQAARCAWGALRHVVVTVGPGVFTGVRAGLAVARALRLALPCTVTGVSTLQALAEQRARGDEGVLVLVDAHKGEVYAQCFDAALAPRAAPRLVPYADVPAQVADAPQTVVFPSSFFQEGRRAVQRCAALDLPHVYEASRRAPLPPVPLYVRAPDALPNRAGVLQRVS